MDLLNAKDLFRLGTTMLGELPLEMSEDAVRKDGRAVGMLFDTYATLHEAKKALEVTQDDPGWEALYLDAFEAYHKTWFTTWLRLLATVSVPTKELSKSTMETVLETLRENRVRHVRLELVILEEEVEEVEELA